MTREFWGIITASFFLSLALGIISPILPPYAKELGATGLWIGLIFSGMNLVRVFLGPVIGRIYDRTLKGRFLLQIGSFISFLSAFAFFYARWYPYLFVARMIQGVAMSFIFPVAGSAVARLAPPGKVSTFLGAYSTAFFFAFGVGPSIGGWMADTWGARYTFLSLAATAVVAFLVITACLDHPKRQLVEERPKPIPISEVFRNPVVLALILYRVVFAMARSTVFSFFPILGKTQGLTNTQVGVVISVQMLLMSFLQFPAGWFADRVERKFLILYATMVGTAITLLILPFLRSFEAYLGIGVAFALTSALSAPTALGMAASEGARNDSTGTVLSVNQSAFGIGMILGPILSGLLFDHLGLTWVFLGGATYVSVGFVLLLLLRSATKETLRLGGIPLPPGLRWIRWRS